MGILIWDGNCYNLWKIMSEGGRLIGYQLTLPDGPRLLPDFEPRYAKRKPGNPPLTLSKTRMKIFAEEATEIFQGKSVGAGDVNNKLTQVTEETEAGVAVHLALHYGEVHEESRPADCRDYRQRYADNLENVLSRMSPTTPLPQVQDMYQVLRDPRMALPAGHGEHLTGPMRTIFGLLAEAALTRVKQQFPFTQTYHLPVSDDNGVQPLSIDPEKFNQTWENDNMDKVVADCVLNFLEYSQGRIQAPRGIGHFSEVRAGMSLVGSNAIFSARPDEIVYGKSLTIPNNVIRVTDYKIGNPDVPTDGLIGEAHHVAAKLTADIVRSLGKIPQTGRAVRLKSADIVPPNLETEVTITHVGLRTNPVKQVKFPGSDLWNNPDASLAERERVADFINSIRANLLIHPELEAIFK